MTKSDASRCLRRSPHRWLLLVALTLSLGVAFTACAGSSSSGDPPTTTSSEAVMQSAYQLVDLTTEDGLTLSGRLYGSGIRAIVLSHMYPADQASWSSQAQRLADEGYLVLTFDFRGYGLSQGQKDLQFLDRDVDAAVHYVRGAGADELVLIGASMGGTASLISASQWQYLSSFRTAGVATLSAPVEFQGLSAREAVADIQIPAMFVAAEGDVGAKNAHELQTLCGGRGDLHILPGDDHGTDLFLGAQADTTWQLLLDFIELCMPLEG